MSFSCATCAVRPPRKPYPLGAQGERDANKRNRERIFFAISEALSLSVVLGAKQQQNVGYVFRMMTGKQIRAALMAGVAISLMSTLASAAEWRLVDITGPVRIA